MRLHDYCTKSFDTWSGGGVTWRGPCARHDMCLQGYKYNSVNSPSACHSDLKYDMKKQCRHYYSKWNPYRFTCYGISYGYFSIVKANTYVNHGGW